MTEPAGAGGDREEREILGGDAPREADVVAEGGAFGAARLSALPFLPGEQKSGDGQEKDAGVLGGDGEADGRTPDDEAVVDWIVVPGGRGEDGEKNSGAER